MVTQHLHLKIGLCLNYEEKMKFKDKMLRYKGCKDLYKIERAKDLSINLMCGIYYS